MYQYLLSVVGVLFLLALVICLLIPRPRRYYWYFVKDSMRNLWQIAGDEWPSRVDGIWGGILSIFMFLLAVIIVLLLSVFFVLFSIIALPTICIVRSFKHPENVDAILKRDKELRVPLTTTPKKSTEELASERQEMREKYMATHFTVPKEKVVFLPDIFEVIFYTPSPAPEIEKLIEDNLEDLNTVFSAQRLHLLFLPEYNRRFNDIETAERLDYYNPRHGALDELPAEVLTYEDIRDALCLPEKVDAPCLIRYNSISSGLHVFSFWKIEVSDDVSILDAVNDYLSKVSTHGSILFSIRNDKRIEDLLEGVPADERFYDDIRIIGDEIRERVDKLRSWGLSTLAIRKFIGDDSDKPGKLLIDKHNRLILTDYGNKEIKLTPIHKAVFFLFLRHPEGIYFKDLGNYREELGRIYKEITGREDMDAVEESINKLTDPYDNSINEKCARIKNAFVSEFREEVAHWYFIDGTKGEKKSIKLPRELVTWEIKD